MLVQGKRSQRDAIVAKIGQHVRKVQRNLIFIIIPLEKEIPVVPERAGQANSWMGIDGAKCFKSKYPNS